MDDSLQCCLSVKIRLDLCIQQDRGSGVYEIESFYDMLLLACLCSWNGGNIFEIHLDFFQRQRTLDRFALAALLALVAAMMLMVIENVLVMVFFMAPLGTLLGTALSTSARERPFPVAPEFVALS